MGLHTVPGMSNYYEPDDDGGYHDDCLTHDDGEALFTAGLQAMREMLAQVGELDNPTLAAILRANWKPSWGVDPGRPEKIANDWNDVPL